MPTSSNGLRQHVEESLCDGLGQWPLHQPPHNHRDLHSSIQANSNSSNTNNAHTRPILSALA